MEPGTTATKTVPINRFNVRSFITNLEDGAKLIVGRKTLLRGIAVLLKLYISGFYIEISADLT